MARFVNDLKENIEKMKISLPEDENGEYTYEDYEEPEEELPEEVSPRLNFVLSSYYKGTGLEEVLKKLEEYLDNADKNESDITNI